MTTFSMMRLPFLACRAALLCVLMLSMAPGVYAQASTGTGLVTAVDVRSNTLVLKTRSGSKAVLVAPTAAIRDDHGQALAFGDIRPGDAVVYHGASNPATSVQVARQFWAIPTER